MTGVQTCALPIPCLRPVKSLLSFAHRLGPLPFNVGGALRIPKSPDGLAARILPEELILKLISSERSPRNAVLLRLLYVSGVRVSESCAIRWRDLQPAVEEGTGQATTGKGRQTRTIKLTSRCWDALQSIRGESGADDPVFRSQRRGGGRWTRARSAARARIACARPWSALTTWCKLPSVIRAWRRQADTATPGLAESSGTYLPA